VFTARYALSPYVKHTLRFKGLINSFVDGNYMLNCNTVKHSGMFKMKYYKSFSSGTFVITSDT
jgi:hypothetical protein